MELALALLGAVGWPIVGVLVLGQRTISKVDYFFPWVAITALSILNTISLLTK
jgi:hypothetical protein